MHPLLELILNPFAGSGFNLIAVMFYVTIALLAFVWALERGMRK